MASTVIGILLFLAGALLALVEFVTAKTIWVLPSALIVGGLALACVGVDLGKIRNEQREQARQKRPAPVETKPAQ